MAKRCDQCLTEGIVILPIRTGYYFEKNSLQKINRIVREGYIYILDSNNKYYGYVITQNRYFQYFDVMDTESTPYLPVYDNKCNKGDNCKALSSFIRIPNPNKDIKTLWVAYSPIKWNKYLINENMRKKDDEKNTFMRKVDVEFLDRGGLYVGGIYPLPYSDDIKSHISKSYEILEYDDENYINPFTKDLYRPNKIFEAVKIKMEILPAVLKGEYTLAVEIKDYIGKLVDLNEFMIQAKLAYQPTQDEVQRQTVARIINSVKNNINEKAKKDAQRHIDRVNKQHDISRPMPRWEGDGPSKAEQRAETQRREENAERYIERQRQGAWLDYSSLIREAEMNTWLSNFEASYKQRQAELDGILTELSAEYEKIFESEDLKNIMTHCFDKNDDISRIYYTLTVQQFLGSTATIPMLSNLYNRHLSNKAASDDDNYLARALVFNQDEVVNRIDSLTPITAGLSTNEIATNSWSGLLYTGSASIFAKYDAIANQVGATVSLAEQLAVPFMKNYRTGKTLSGLMISQKEYLFGYHHEKALIIVKGQGSYADARRALMSGIMHIAGDGSLPTKIRESVDQALKTSGEAARLNKTISQNFIYYIDKNQLRAGMNVYQNSSKAYADKNALRRVIDQSVNMTSELYDQSYKDYKRFADITNRRIDLAIRTHYFGAMLQTVACVFLVNAFFQAKTQEDRLVEGSKAVAGLMVLLGGSLEMRGNASKLLAGELKLQRGAGNLVSNEKILTAERSAKSLSTVARGLSLGGAAIFAGFDIESGRDAKENDNETMMWAYYGSAATGAGSTLLLTLSLGATATGIGVVLLIGFIGINLFIGYWKKSGMENWLNLSVWGIENANWSLKHTLEQFDRAVVGDDIDLKDN